MFYFYCHLSTWKVYAYGIWRSEYGEEKSIWWLFNGRGYMPVFPMDVQGWKSQCDVYYNWSNYQWSTALTNFVVGDCWRGWRSGNDPYCTNQYEWFATGISLNKYLNLLVLITLTKKSRFLRRCAVDLFKLDNCTSDQTRLSKRSMQLDRDTK